MRKQHKSASLMRLNEQAQRANPSMPDLDPSEPHGSTFNSLGNTS